MILKIYSVLDHAVGAYLQPFFARSEGEALRMLRTAVNQPDHQFHTNAADYSLSCLGEFDDSNGDINIDNRQNLINLASLLPVTPPTAQ